MLSILPTALANRRALQVLAGSEWRGYKYEDKGQDEKSKRSKTTR